MRQLQCKQYHPTQGQITVNMRIIGKEIFQKIKNREYERQIVNDLKKKGAIVEQAGGWLKINIFGKHKRAIIDGKEFDVKETSSEELEDLLFDFFYKKYLEAKFVVKDVGV